MAAKKKKTNPSVRRLYNSHKVFIGGLMRFEDENPIILALSNTGKFIARFDGESTVELPSGEFFANGNCLYELILKYFKETPSDTPTTSSMY